MADESSGGGLDGTGAKIDKNPVGAEGGDAHPPGRVARRAGVDADVVLLVAEVAGSLVGARLLWWMVADFVLDHVDLPGL